MYQSKMTDLELEALANTQSLIRSQHKRLSSDHTRGMKRYMKTYDYLKKL